MPTGDQLRHGSTLMGRRPWISAPPSRYTGPKRPTFRADHRLAAVPGRLRRPETGLPQLVIMTWVYPGVRSSHDHVRPDPARRNVIMAQVSPGVHPTHDHDVSGGRSPRRAPAEAVMRVGGRMASLHPLPSGPGRPGARPLACSRRLLPAAPLRSTKQVEGEIPI